MVQSTPEAGKVDHEILEQFDDMKEAVTAIRKIRKEKELPVREKLDLMVRDQNQSYSKRFESILAKLGSLDSIEETKEKPEGAVSFRIKSVEYFIPLDGHINLEEEMRKLEEELVYEKGFLDTVMAKLSNERFVQNAPTDVVGKEQKKKEDARKKIDVLQERIAGLQKE